MTRTVARPAATTGTTRTADTPAKQVAAFLARFDPAVAKVARAARRHLRRRYPTAVELVYDNYAALAMGFAANERTSDTFVSVAAYATGVSLYFTHGVGLPDPLGLLQGTGNQGRFVRLTSARVLDEPGVAALLDAAVARARTPLPDAGRGYTVVKSVSARQRPRRPS
jgi:hypothetical protein